MKWPKIQDKTVKLLALHIFFYHCIFLSSVIKHFSLKHDCIFSVKEDKVCCEECT